MCCSCLAVEALRPREAVVPFAAGPRGDLAADGRVDIAERAEQACRIPSLPGGETGVMRNTGARPRARNRSSIAAKWRVSGRAPGRALAELTRLV